MPSGRAPSPLWSSLARRLRAAFQDLFGDEPAAAGSAPADPWEDEATALLAQAQAQLTELRAAWAAALVRARQADRQLQADREAAARLDVVIDAALHAGREAEARAAQRELNMWPSRLDHLAERHRAEAALAKQLAEAVRTLEQKIAAARRQLDELSARHRMTAAHEQLGGLRETMARLADGLREGKGRAL